MFGNCSNHDHHQLTEMLSYFFISIETLCYIYNVYILFKVTFYSTAYVIFEHQW